MIRIALGIVATVLFLPCAVLAETPTTNAPPVSAPTNAATTNTDAEAQEKAAAAAAMAVDGCTVEEFTVHSPSMGREIKALVILPPEYKNHPDKKYPVLYALHGSQASPEAFSKMVTLRAALKDKPMVIASFDGDSSGMYIDSPLPRNPGRDPKDNTLVKSLFTTFFFNEFVPYVDQHYRVNPKQRMLTGFSMGGNGAFLYMAMKPNMFVSVSSMSGGFHNMAPPDDKNVKWFESFMGPYAQNQALYQSVDVDSLIKADLAKGEKLPPLYLCCGTEDHLLAANQAMRDFLKAQGVPCEYHEGPGGHTWAFWKGSAPGIMEFHWNSLQKK